MNPVIQSPNVYPVDTSQNVTDPGPVMDDAYKQRLIAALRQQQANTTDGSTQYTSGPGSRAVQNSSLGPLAQMLQAGMGANWSNFGGSSGSPGGYYGANGAN